MSKKRIYKGLLTQAERLEADRRLAELEKAIPQAEMNLLKKHNTKNNRYRYELGQILNDFIIRHNVSLKERSYYWEEIKEHASSDQSVTKDRSKKRMDYEYCYILYNLGWDTVSKLSWRQWQDILDRKTIHEDSRIFLWIASHEGKIPNNIWRDFNISLNIFFKKRDTSVYNDSELIALFDKLFEITLKWHVNLKKYVGKYSNLTDARKAQRTKYLRKYFTDAFEVLKFSDYADTDNHLTEIFKRIYLIKDDKSILK